MDVMAVTWVEFFGFSSGLLALIAAIPYITSMLRGETKPERAAFLIWGVTSTLSFLAYWAQGAQDSVWFAVGDLIVAIIMVGGALKFGYGWVKFRDSLGLFVAFGGIALWAITSEPLLALISSIAIDAVASTLVALKSLEAPETEHLAPWAMYLVATIFAVAAVGSLDYSLLLYPVYAAVASIGIIVSILVGRSRKANVQS